MPLWSPPKTDWATTDGIANTDLNRMEQNIKDLRDAVYKRVQGFGYNSDIGAAYINIFPGCCFSEDYYPLKFAGGIKALTAHALGFGASVGGMAHGLTVSANTWYYIFALGHVTSGAVEIMIDDNPAGHNVVLSNYPYKRFVNSFKTDASSNVCEMYSTGDDVYINPVSMFNDREITFNNDTIINNDYQTVTLQTGGSEGYALPAREVWARLNVWGKPDLEAAGFYSLIPAATSGNAFSVPAILYSALEYSAEALMLFAANKISQDVEIMVNSSRQLALAMYGPGPYGALNIAVRGYRDLREI